MAYGLKEVLTHIYRSLTWVKRDKGPETEEYN